MTTSDHATAPTTSAGMRLTEPHHTTLHDTPPAERVDATTFRTLLASVLPRPHDVRWQ